MGSGDRELCQRNNTGLGFSKQKGQLCSGN